MATSCTSDPVPAAGCAGLPPFLVPTASSAGLLSSDFALLGLRVPLGFPCALTSAVSVPLT